MQKELRSSFKVNKRDRLVLSVIVPVIVGALLNLNGCSALQSVNVIGKEADMSLFSGEWVGEYYNQIGDRGGDIVFRLAESESQAQYEVVLTPHGYELPYRLVANHEDLEAPPPQTLWLIVSFIQIRGRKIVGRLTPYRDPEAGLCLITTFEGQIKQDVVEGTFTSYVEHSNDCYHGDWKMVRTKTNN